ncbi:MAG: hypothetical protein JWP29_3403 [Rhodoferax sp.]|nr:hypothetical protein [Rhodoferax sp.]
MQITPLETRPPSLASALQRSTATLRTLPLASVARFAAARPANTFTANLPAGGLADWQPGLQTQVASAQQALQFIDRLAIGLQKIKLDLGSAIAGAPVPPERLEQQRQQLSQLWNTRATQAGGQLDSRLVFSDDSPAMQGFAVRGLDAAALRSGGRETLAIALGTPTPARPASLVVLEPGLDANTVARLFDQALAPMGLRAEAGANGGVRFSAPEGQWTAVRDTLSIRGEGLRFATGTYHRVLTEAEPAAIATDTWSLDGGAASRQTLQQIVDAQGRVGRARDAAQSLLQHSAAALDASDSAHDAAWAGRYAASFEAAATNAAPGSADGAAGSQIGPLRFQTLAAVQAALPRVSRQRVLSLLASSA